MANEPIRAANNGLGELRLGQRRYVLLDRLSPTQERYKALDRYAGPKGDLRVIQKIPYSRSSLNYVGILKRIAAGNDNVPTILDYGVVGNQIAIVLSWITGPSLRAYLNDGRFGVSVFEAFRLFKGLSHGVTQLSHRRKIVHGDIKPENLVLCSEPRLRLVMIDFGSAWTIERTATRAPMEGKTERYAAPELLRGEHYVDDRSDQFSVFVVFYEMLTRTRPYGGHGGLAGLDGYEDYRTLELPSKKSRDRNKLMDSVWKKIDAACLKGLNLNLENRFRGRREWLDAVRDIDYEIQKTSRLEGANLVLAHLIETGDRLWTKITSWVTRFRKPPI